MKRSITGFTLIEIMIAVAIVAILAAIALPSYQEQTRKTRRSDAMAALEKAAARQEQYYFQYTFYTNNENLLGGSSGVIRSPEGYYQIAADFVDGDNRTFLLTATPSGGSPQTSDSDCASFTLNHLGVRGAQDDNDAGNTDRCWNR